MTGDGTEAEPWHGDVNEAVVADWTEETTTFDRVRAVADATSNPETASEIADRAHVSEPTARKHLTTLADSGHLKAIESNAGTTFMRSPQRLALRRISTIHREHTKGEIRDGIRDLKQELSELRGTYDVSDVDELAIELGADDDGWRDVARWRQIEQNLDVAQAALSLYDFDPDNSRATTAGDGESSRASGDSTTDQGALGDSSGTSSA